MIGKAYRINKHMFARIMARNEHTGAYTVCLASPRGVIYQPMHPVEVEEITTATECSNKLFSQACKIITNSVAELEMNLAKL